MQSHKMTKQLLFKCQKGLGDHYIDFCPEQLYGIRRRKNVLSCLLSKKDCH